MQIIQTVIVKQILTENSKSELLDSSQLKKQQLQKEIEQLKFERRKLEKIKKVVNTSANGSYDKEMKSRAEKIKILDFQMDQIHMLPIGSEIKEKEIQGLVEVVPGDNWDQLQAFKTIIIKDGIVQEIR
ncbi:YlqD family protein [Litchfieldia alkalitelluris]|uniref:YlqD family protein n=1 Tax=Litchfieldia alkalitelluris TaxID=304268 RepID=UPI000998E3F2|nr:YlqD family protein [Litchfieldia alkalitelluris]